MSDGSAPSVLSRVWGAWDRFWFSPVSARSLGWMRVSLGLMLVWWWAWLGTDLELLFWREGVADQVLMDHKRTPWALGWLDGLSLGELRAVWGAGLALMIAYTLGIATPVVRWLVVLAMVSMYHADPWAWNGGDRLIRIWTVILAVTPCGAAVSVDAWWRVRRGLQVPEWVSGHGHRLVQIQLALMYTWTGIAKLGDPLWRDGSAIYWSVLDGSFNRMPDLLDPILRSGLGPWLSVLLVTFTLVFEVGFAPLVAWSRTRNATLVAGVVLHMGIFLTMSVGMFQPASLWGYQAFIGRRPDASPPSP